MHSFYFRSYIWNNSEETTGDAKTAPNDARRVVWALGELFFKNIFVFFLLNN